MEGVSRVVLLIEGKRGVTSEAPIRRNEKEHAWWMTSALSMSMHQL